MAVNEQMNMRDYHALHLDTDAVEQQHCYISLCKKSLKIPKGQSESVYRRRTDNTMKC
jgi:hypothetical protein